MHIWLNQVLVYKVSKQYKMPFLAPLAYSLTGGYDFKHTLKVALNETGSKYVGEVYLSNSVDEGGIKHLSTVFKKIKDKICTYGFNFKSCIDSYNDRNIYFYMAVGDDDTPITSLHSARSIEDDVCKLKIDIVTKSSDKIAKLILTKLKTYLNRSHSKTKSRCKIHIEVSDIKEIPNLSYKIRHYLYISFY